MKLISIIERGVRSLLFRKFETVELLLAISLLLHGLWLVFPEWAHLIAPATPRLVELVAGWSLVACGGLHAPLVLADLMSRASLWLRSILSMSSFIGHGFLFAITWLAVGPASLFVVPYIILTLLAALAYLSLSAAKND